MVLPCERTGVVLELGVSLADFSDETLDVSPTAQIQKYLWSGCVLVMERNTIYFDCEALDVCLTLVVY